MPTRKPCSQHCGRTLPAASPHDTCQACQPELRCPGCKVVVAVEEITEADGSKTRYQPRLCYACRLESEAAGIPGALTKTVDDDERPHWDAVLARQATLFPSWSIAFMEVKPGDGIGGPADKYSAFRCAINGVETMASKQSPSARRGVPFDFRECGESA